MKQYCRYCAHCCMQDDDLYICIEDNGTSNKAFDNKSIRRANKCKRFMFNEIAVDDHDQIYKSQEQRAKRKTNVQQIKMEV